MPNLVLQITYHAYGDVVRSKPLENCKVSVSATKPNPTVVEKIRKAISHAAAMHNAPKVMTDKVSELFYDARLLYSYKPFTESQLALILSRENRSPEDLRVQVTLTTRKIADRALAVAMALHWRVGQASPLHRLSPDLMQILVLKMFA